MTFTSSRQASNTSLARPLRVLQQTAALPPVVVRGALLVISWLSLHQVTLAQVEPAETKPVSAVTAKLMRYCQRVVERHDANADGFLDAKEWAQMHGQPAAADLNRDGRLTVDEFAQYAANYGAGRRIRLSTRPDGPGEAIGSEPGIAGTGAAEADAAAATANSATAPLDRRRGLRFFAPLPAGTPSWFVERDTDGDAQLTLSEFSPRLRGAEVAEFKRSDANGDGLLTPAELARAASKSAAATTAPAVPAAKAPNTP
jgi:hypothetical protein